MHTLQPQHKKLDEKEVSEILEKFNIGLSQFPKISLKDVALSDKFSKGDVVEIKRGDSIYYRVVV